MHLIVGLGNPGAKYAKTRHNVGWWLLDKIAERYNFSVPQSKFNGRFCKGKIGEFDCVLVWPETMMNLSGKSVQAAAAFFKIPPQNIWVLHDELDLPVGKVKFKQGGSDGGHNGLKDITARLGADYFRLRIGIDHPGHKDMVSGYVLSNPKPDEAQILVDVCDDMARVFEAFLAGNGNDVLSVRGMN